MLVAVACKGEAPIGQIAKDSGIGNSAIRSAASSSPSCLQCWMKLADVEDGNRPGTTREESAELRELKKRSQMLMWAET